MRRVAEKPDHATTVPISETGTRLVQAAVTEAEKLLHMGEPLLAYNAIQQALEDAPDEVRLRQLRGLALARSGALLRANQELTSLRREGHTDGETMGLLARTHKDLALAMKDGTLRQHHLDAAFSIYVTGYRESLRRVATADAYYTGINAATMAFLRNDYDVARELAVEVEKLCRSAVQQCADAACAYWPQATLAEAALILGNYDVARERYRAAAKLAGTHYGDLSSTRRQARLLLEHLQLADNWLDTAMHVPPVLVYTGHMIDVAQRAIPRFPPELETQIRAEIHSRIERIAPAAAYGSAACGADILCLECVRELGGELHIVLPFPVEHFRAKSVELRPEGDWGQRFERLLEDAKEVLVIGERPPPGGTSTYEYANLMMTGLARLRAQMLDTNVQALAVWDGTAAGDTGGTGSVVSMWRECGLPLEHVPLIAPQATRTGTPVTAVAVTDTRAEGPAAQWPFDYVIKSMLFADAVGYSRLSEEQIPLFFEHYLGTIAAFNAATHHRAEHVETAGDGMYMVFGDPETAANYALGLSERLKDCDWEQLGLPANLGERIGLHCGPVFKGADPITGAPIYSGIHTSRTARIEPITPPGQVYASSAFAAVAATQGCDGLRFSYIGRTQLAKDYGVLPLYHVKRTEYAHGARYTR
jgi:class 3 adenylate cyclase/tetratricopeptide (TPR) repeat protein